MQCLFYFFERDRRLGVGFDRRLAGVLDFLDKDLLRRGVAALEVFLGRRALPPAAMSGYSDSLPGRGCMYDATNIFTFSSAHSAQSVLRVTAVMGTAKSCLSHSGHCHEL
jgi:hypothetical protein